MDSALVITPDPHLHDQKGVRRLEEFLSACHGLASEANLNISITWQHNIHKDHFVILAEAGKRTFGHHGRLLADTFYKATEEIKRYTKEIRDEKLPAKKKQAARKEGGCGRQR